MRFELPVLFAAWLGQVVGIILSSGSSSARSTISQLEPVIRSVTSKLKGV
jgi:hypothetical protein